MKKFAIICSLLFLQNFFEAAFAQSNYNSEEALIKEALNFYAAGKYANAAPLYAQLLSTHPLNASYNLNYGVSLMYASKNKSEAVHHLEIAAGLKGIPSEEANYYLAKAYHLNYEFTKALERLEMLNKNSKENKELKQKAGLLASQCRNAMAYDYNAFDEFIISKEETNEDKGIILYNFDKYSGKFLAMPENFVKGKSNKEKFSPYVFLSSFGNTIVFSGPGKSDATELFISRKKSGNAWDNAEQIKFKNPLTGDKNSPVISADGDTIYFSWNGSNSIGGFDVFKSVFNFNTKLWSDPENLGPPINSVCDDFDYLPSSDGTFAYISSARGSDAGKIYVLRIDLKNLKSPLQVPSKNISVEQALKNENNSIYTNDKQLNSENKKIDTEIPEQSIASKENETDTTQIKNPDSGAAEEELVTKTNALIIKGLFYSTDQPLSMNAKITAVNQNDPSQVFTAETNPKTGEYALLLPSEGNYNLIIEKDGYRKTEQVIELKNGNETEITQRLIVGKDKNGEEHFLVMDQSYKNEVDKANSTDLIYKIQIGAFVSKSIEEITEKFKASGIKNIICQSKENGVHVFYTGETKDFSSAVSGRKELIEKGISDAFVVAFSGSTQISIEEALLKNR